MVIHGTKNGGHIVTAIEYSIGFPDYITPSSKPPWKMSTEKT